MEHHIDLKRKKNVLVIAIILNTIIVISQIIFGILSHSISLITDAVHNFQDVVSLIIAYVASVFMIKKPNNKMTYGYLRAEAMAGFVNSAVLIGAIILLILTAIERLIFPQPVDSFLVIIVGTIAFIINALSAYMLGFHSHNHHHKDEDLNIKSAYLHLLSDALISLGVVIGAIFMYLFSVYWLDPVLSIIFSIYILKETFPILRKTYHILMEGVPVDIDYNEIKKLIKEIPNVKDIHDIHIWALSSKDLYFTGHIIIDDCSLSNIEKIFKQVEKILNDKGINHITLQPETNSFKCNNQF